MVQLIHPLIFASFLILFFLFTTQVKDHLQKYFERSTTQAITYSREKLKFPAATVCAENGFKTKIMEEKLNLSKYYWRYSEDLKVLDNSSYEWRIPDTVAEFDEWWKMSTYDREELIETASIAHGATKKLIEILNFTTMNTVTLGRCYTTRTNYESDSEDVLASITLNIPDKLDLLKIYLHDEADKDVIITGNFPLVNFKTIVIRRGMIYGILLTKRIHVNKANSKCQNDVNECLMRRVSSKLPCYMPTAGNYAKGKAICKNMKEAYQTNQLIYNIMEATKICGEPCELRAFDFQKFIVPETSHVGLELGDKAGGNQATLYMRFTSLVVTKSQEVVMYDFNSILSSVGGSLGLFLGFSCFGTVSDIINWITNRKYQTKF